MNYTQSELNQLIEQLKTLLTTKLDPAFVKKEGGTLNLEVGEIEIRVNASVWDNKIILKDDFLRYASFGNMRIFVDEIAEPIGLL
jgi:hypothetical protein